MKVPQFLDRTQNKDIGGQETNAQGQLQSLHKKAFSKKGSLQRASDQVIGNQP